MAKQTTVANPTVETQNFASLQSKRTRCEVWTRVMGYHRSVSHFNKGKKVEHYSRKHFNEKISANSAFTEKYGCK